MGKEGKDRNVNTDVTVGLGMVRARRLYDSYLGRNIHQCVAGLDGQVRPGHRGP